MTPKTRNPSNWEEYEYGTGSSPHRDSVSSAGGRSVRFSEQGDGAERIEDEENGPLSPPTEDGNGGPRRRRSSFALRFNSLTQRGGVNSIENFARSWTRAAGFLEAAPHRPSFILQSDQEPNENDVITFEYGRGETGQFLPGRSLLSASFAGRSPENAIDDEFIAPEDATPAQPLLRKESDLKRLGGDMVSVSGSIRGRESIFAIAPHLATPLGGSYGSSYGTLRSTLNESSMNRATESWNQQQVAAAYIDEEREPMLLKKAAEHDGIIVVEHDGQSTLPQTIFNSTNVLIGVGLLSLPMGIRYAGWVCGMGFLLFSALITAYTAGLLAKCLDADPRMVSFSDLAQYSYGGKATIATSALFTMELLAACVALVVLFADTLNLLIPGVGVTEWKILCGLLLIPLHFAPLRLLSFTSILGIMSCFSIVIIVFMDGFIKPYTPGSLREPAPTYMFPSNWLTLPLSFGLLMSPWGGHSVFPSIYRDMRHPHKFPRAIKYTFSFTYILDCLTAVAGILMFGDGVMDAITSNILGQSGYPQALSLFLCIFISIIPLTKIPLNARPIVATLEGIAGLGPKGSPALTISSWTRGILKIAIRLFVVCLYVTISIVVPAFDSIMAFMGSALCFTICVILPILFYLKIFGDKISRRERIFDYFLITISSIMALVGTVFAFLPKSMIGAE